jgi:hypothetical protein
MKGGLESSSIDLPQYDTGIVPPAPNEIVIAGSLFPHDVVFLAFLERVAISKLSLPWGRAEVGF